MRVNVILILSFFLLLVQCKPVKAKQDYSLLLEMRKTACLGVCPAYSVKIFNTGKVLYNGERFVPYEGSKEVMIKKEEMDLIRKAIKESSFFSLKDVYSADVTDLPTTYISCYEKDIKKSIVDYYGAPKELKDLEAMIEKTVFGYLEE